MVYENGDGEVEPPLHTLASVDGKETQVEEHCSVDLSFETMSDRGGDRVFGSCAMASGGNCIIEEEAEKEGYGKNKSVG